jgi:hypothetical protein
MTTLAVFLLLLITPWLPPWPIEESAHLQGRRQYKDTKNQRQNVVSFLVLLQRFIFWGKLEI